MRPGQAALEGVHIIDALADVNPFAEQILVRVRHRARVQIQADIAGKDARKAGAVDAGRRDLDPGLQQRITGDDGATARIELGAIERMRERGDQPVRGFARHDRIGIQRDDVLDLTQHFQIARLHAEGSFCAAAQQQIELVQFAAFALPAHPALFARIPFGIAMEEIKWPGRFAVVFLVERTDAGAGLLDQRVTLRLGLSRRVGQIGEQRKVQMRILVAQKVQFHLLEQRLHFGRAGQAATG